MNRFVTLLAASAALTLSAVARPASAAAAAATAGDACVSDKAKDSLNACGGTGPAKFDVSAHGKAPQVNFHSAPPPADLK
jgi:hypothetical protein